MLVQEWDVIASAMRGGEVMVWYTKVCQSKHKLKLTAVSLFHEMIRQRGELEYISFGARRVISDFAMKK
jgi:hypothetical protein